MADATTHESKVELPGSINELISSWYCKELVQIPAPVIHIFESYCKLPASSIKPHIFEIRDKAWTTKPYWYIGGFRFLHIYLLSHPRGQEIISRLLQNDSNEIFLDIGCGLGQDIRYLLTLGVKKEKVYGLDADQTFIDLGYELFLDKDTLSSQFFAHDFVNGENDDASLLDGNKATIILLANILHLFDLPTQKLIARRLLSAFLELRKGAMIVGNQLGSINPGNAADGYCNLVTKKDWHPSYQSVAFWHDEESFRKLWKEVTEELGSGEVVVRVEMRDWEDMDAGTGLVVEDRNVPSMQSPDVRQFVFSVERV